MQPPIILASTSPWRASLLAAAGLRVEQAAPGVDEASIAPPDPSERALARASAKAERVAARRPDAIVLAADQVADLDGRPFGKPVDRADHLALLRRLVGRRHELVTAAVVRPPGGVAETVHIVERTGVRLRSGIPTAWLEAYVDSGEGAGCAGGYRIEGRGAWLVEAVEGDWFNVVGLPLLPVLGALARLGVQPAWRDR